jgi:hypothetical protein
MKVGDVIKLKGSFKETRVGMLVSETKGNWNGWWNILDSDGLMVMWPETMIEVLNADR